MPNASGTLRLYPRGFLGAEVFLQVARTPDEFSDLVKQHTFMNKDRVAPTREKIAGNPMVESLYAQMVRLSPEIHTFGFRKQVLIAALTAFGTKNFKAWYWNQHRSPSAGDMHNRFLVDTLKFIETGRRSVSVENWAALLKMTDEGDRIGDISPEAKKYFESKYDESLVSTIQRWVSHPAGLADLLNTLHILFGNPQ